MENYYDDDQVDLDVHYEHITNHQNAYDEQYQYHVFPYDII